MMQVDDGMKARYQELVKSRQKTVERGYKCLCCRDTGLIPYDVIQRYRLAEGMLGEYESIFRGESGILCRATNCEGNETLITKPLQDGSSEEKLVSKFAEWAVSEEISPDTCNWVHQQEWERWKAFDQQNMKSAQPPNLNKAIAAIAKPMPKANLAAIESSLSPVQSDAIPTEEECEGFKVGDRVVVNIDRFDEEVRNQLVKEDGVPVGARGVVKSFRFNPAGFKVGMKQVLAAVLFGADEIREFPVEYFLYDRDVAAATGKRVLEYQGFRVGDVVRITLDQVSEQDRRDILKSGLCPHDGKIGTISRWQSNESLGQGLKIFEPVIDVEGGEWIGSIAWLQPLEVAA